jgi:mRNA interferase HicA
MPFKYRDIERRLLKSGYQVVRQKGSHVIFSNGKNTFPVPNHGSKDISPGVERQILKILDLSVDEFRKIQ